MDELKLVKWKDSFDNAVKNLKIEFESYLQDKKFEDIYELRIGDTGNNLSLIITDDNLPESLKHRLEKLLVETQPEDSI